MANTGVSWIARVDDICWRGAVCGWLRLYVGGALLERAHEYDKILSDAWKDNIDIGFISASPVEYARCPLRDSGEEGIIGLTHYG